MRKLFILVFVANVALAVVSFVLLPSKAVSEMMALLACEVLFFVLFLLVPSSVSWVPKGSVNLPNKDYWLKEENKPKLKAKLEALTSECGAAFLAFCFCLGLLMLKANLSDPVRLNEGIFFAACIALMSYMVYFCVKFFSFFNMPKNDEAAGGKPNGDPVNRAP